MGAPKAPADTGLSRLFRTLKAAGSEYAGASGKGGQFFCPNPEHDDQHASFDVSVGTKGIPIFTCTPCRDAMGQDGLIEVLRDVGVSWHGDPVDPAFLGDIDWGPAAPSSGGGGSGSTGEVTLSVVYTYMHADGSKNFKVKRYDPVVPGEGRKRFSPERWDTNSLQFVGGKGAIDNVTRTPYALQLFAKWDVGQPVWLVEGEKAAKALLNAGEQATTFHGGTSGKLEPDWTKWFEGFEDVRVCPDADEIGVKRALELKDALEHAGVPVSLWGVDPETAQPKDDAADAIDREEELVELGDHDLDFYRGLHPMPVRAERKPSDRRTVVPAKPFGIFGGKPLIGAEDEGSVEVLLDPEEREALPFGSQGNPFSVKVGVDPVEFAYEYLEHLHSDPEFGPTIRYHADEASFYRWLPHRKHYVRLLDEHMEAIIKSDLRGLFETDDVNQITPIRVKKKTGADVMDGLRTAAIVRSDAIWDIGQPLEPASGGVPFMNGWLNIATKELEPTGPHKDIRWAVPLDYTKGKALEPGSEWFRFLDSLGWVDGSDERKLLREWFGYLLSGSKTQQKIMLLLGPKRAGKGTILKIASAMLGSGAVGTDINTLTGEFGLSNLMGKSLAAIGDARFSMRTDKRVVERLLSLAGDDLMSVNIKNKPILSIRLDARIMVATNETPDFIEASDALASRFIVLKFNETFYGKEDKTLDLRIMAELPEIIRWALGGLVSLERLGKFSETQAGLEIQNQMVESSAPVRIFVEEMCDLGGTYIETNDDLYDSYRIWCEKGGHFRLNSIRFHRDLLTAFDGRISNDRRRVAGKAQRVKAGIRLRAK